MTEFEFSKVPAEVQIEGKFDNTCTISVSELALEALKNGKLKVRISHSGRMPHISNAKIILSSVSGNIKIFIHDHDSCVTLGENTSGAFDLRLWRQSTVTIAENTTSNGIRIVCDMSEVTIGRDCMFSDGILFQSADEHGIVDLQTGKIVNNIMRKICIGDHVWLGRQSTLLPDISIGQGSIVGAGAIVANDIPEMSVAVGIPARVVKTKTTWSRSTGSLDNMAKKYVERYR